MLRESAVASDITLASINLPRLHPSRAITQLAWRPLSREVNVGRMEGVKLSNDGMQLAVASEDNSLRIFRVSIVP